MTALLKRTEHEATSLIPNLIRAANQSTIDLINALAQDNSMSTSERLAILLAQVTDGKPRTVEAEKQSA